VFLVGGGARSEAVRRIAPAVLGVPVLVPPAGEYVADGAARQAAWTLTGESAPPAWSHAVAADVANRADPGIGAALRARYREARELTLSRM
jgi:xylulokinase